MSVRPDSSLLPELSLVWCAWIIWIAITRRWLYRPANLALTKCFCFLFTTLAGTVLLRTFDQKTVAHHGVHGAESRLAVARILPTLQIRQLNLHACTRPHTERTPARHCMA
ncbi:hypothetical protein EXIGLDRAFT_83321 [Exidia glandulosa HHB12029]|uniref:Uncharacterized protein n=1 Tax=Exidia glandulosa HHB12029 TaxID=1314781 RepID=A0A165HJ16_EXIGL|nr:hypothetical protein EXIGLDRAFT_83321 [Exidia glandulosa HHB12029]